MEPASWHHWSLCCAQSLPSRQTLQLYGLYSSGSSVHGILQARTLEWVAISISRGSSWLSNGTRISCVCCIAGRFFIPEPPGRPIHWFMGALNSCLKKKTKKILWNFPEIAYYSRRLISGDFPGHPTVRTPPFHCRGLELHLWLEN